MRDAVRAFATAAARDSAARPLAIYRRARVLVRLGDSTAIPALAGFAAGYPTDSAARERSTSWPTCRTTGTLGGRPAAGMGS